MTSNQDLLDAAMGSPPPSTVDVDAVIARQRRRARYQKVGVGVSAGAMVAAFALVLTMLPHAVAPPRIAQTGSTPTVTATTPSPSPTLPDYSKVAARLTTALAFLPKALHVPSNAKFDWQPMDNANPPVAYFASWKVSGVTYSMTIWDEGQPPDPKDNGCAPGNVGEMACTRTVAASGITYKLNNAIDKLDPVHHKNASQLSVSYYAADGTHIDFNAGAGSHYVLPLSYLKIMAKGTHSAWLTLNPQR